jgi:hypothetical protein
VRALQKSNIPEEKVTFIASFLTLFFPAQIKRNRVDRIQKFLEPWDDH